MRFTLFGFNGAIKAPQPRLMPDNIGVDSVNQNPSRGDLRPWREATTVATVPSGQKTIYRMGRDVASDNQYWLSWTTAVHAVRGFLASDTTERTYFTGSGTPKVTDNAIGLATSPYPTAARELGVPKPSAAMTLTQSTAGTGDDELRFYAETWVTDKQEESAPGPVRSITVKPGAIIDISGLSSPPAGNFGIATRRIYRTQPGNASEFFLLREVPIASTTTQDDARALSASEMETAGPAGTSKREWGRPPADLKCLTGMWNGMMAGISGRSVRYCEPYAPYAWPQAYETLPPDVTPVGLGVWSKNLLILTTGRPYLVNGSAPEDLGDDPIDFHYSCISERSIVSMAGGVVWASPDGLAYYGSGGGRILTSGIFTKQDWQALNPSSMVGCQYQGAYLCLYEQTSGVWKGFFIDPADPKGVYFLSAGYSAAFYDALQNSLYLLDGTSIKKWEGSTSLMTASFKSKMYRATKPVNLGWVEVVADTYPVTVKVDATWVDVLGTSRSVTQTRSVPSSQPVSLLGGFLATDWQIEVTTGVGGVQGVVIADSIRELAQS